MNAQFSNQKSLQPIVEPMRLEDLNRILEIEQASFNQPYSRELFEEELKLTMAFPHVVRLGSKIVGYIDYWVVKDEVHLINVAVDPEYRRLHLGTLLMEHLIKVGLEKGALRITLDVRESNLAALRLYENFGFEKTAVRRRYYTDNQEDAWVMIKDLAHP